MSDEFTTAQIIGKFYKELVDEGIPVDLAYEIARDASRVIVDADQNLVVSR